MIRTWRLAPRIATLFLALLGLAAVFADWIAADAPLAAKHHGRWLLLPAVTAPAAWRRIEAEPLEAVVRAPLAASPDAAPSSAQRVLAQTVHGTRSTVLTALGVVLLALALGVPLGSLAGRASFADALLSRSVELTGALPALVLVATLHAGGLRPGWLALVLVLGALRAVEIARLVRGEVLRVSGTDFVLAAKALGASPREVLLRHVLPHVWGPAIVSATFGAAAVVLLEAALGFVGLGLPEGVPSWGRSIGRVAADGSALWLLGPGVAIFATTVCLYVVADALDDRVSARRRGASRV